MVYTISSNKAIGYTPHTPVAMWGGSSLLRKTLANETKKQLQKPEQICSTKSKQVTVLHFDKDIPVDLPITEVDNIHVMSRRTKMKIRDKIEIFYASSSKNNFSLVTLSFINKVDDKQAQQCLNKFLTVVRKRKPDANYIWVAERQNENYKYHGNIHFHIVFNTTFNIKEYNQLWVIQQYNCGIVFEGVTKDMVKLHRKEGTVQTILNPFDIKRITCTHGLSAYLTNYVTKNNDEFKCRVWGSSRVISKLYTKTVISHDQFKQLELPFNSRLNKKTGQLYVNKTFNHFIPDAITGEQKLICTINSVINKKYFQKHFMQDLIEINKLILQGQNIYSPKMGFDAYDSLIDNPHNYSDFWQQKQITKIMQNQKNEYYKIDFSIIGAKHYQRTFNIDYKTARVWYNDDLILYGRNRLTMHQFYLIYADITPLAPPTHADFIAEICPTLARNSGI